MAKEQMNGNGYGVKIVLFLLTVLCAATTTGVGWTMKEVVENGKAIARLPTTYPPDWFIKRVDKIESNLEKLSEETEKLATIVHRMETKVGNE